MATNTIAGVSLTEVAQRSLDILLPELFPLTAFTNDFSDEISAKGTAITTRYPSAVTAGDLTGGYNSQNTTLTAVSVSLDNFIGFVYGFKDYERSRSAVALNDLFVVPAINAIALNVMGAALGLLTLANFPSNVSDTTAAANFDADHTAALSQALTDAFVPRQGRALILKTGYYTNLVQDNAIQNNQAYGSPEAIREGTLPRVSGFTPYQYTQFPLQNENLSGMACGKQGIIMAARVVDATGFEQQGGELMNLTVPEIGITLQFRKWYDQNAGELKYSMSILYGVALGIKGYIRPIRSA